MYYKNNLGYDYPDRSDQHMLKVKHLVDTNFDENFDYLDKLIWYKIKRGFLWVALNVFVFPICTIRYGLKIYGKENIRKNRKYFKKGAITICNHVLMWDYICVLKAIRPHLQFHPGWKTNFEGPNRKLIRLVGGIPVPTDNPRAMVKFSQAIDEVLYHDRWLHFFPEGSMWYYYPDIRPLKKAVFKYAVKHNKPVIPMTLSFRPRKGIWKLFGKNPLVDMHIGEPIFPDKSLPINEAIDKIHTEAYHVMQVLNGINPGDPTYNINQNIDQYQKTM